MGETGKGCRQEGQIVGPTLRRWRDEEERRRTSDGGYISSGSSKGKKNWAVQLAEDNPRGSVATLSFLSSSVTLFFFVFLVFFFFHLFPFFSSGLAKT